MHKIDTVGKQGNINTHSWGGKTLTKEKFLTIRWNNILSAGLGIPTLIYVIFAFSTSFWLEREGLIGLAIFGALFWIIIELHTATRFAWLQKNSATYVSVKQGYAHPLALIRLVHNAVFWVFLLPFLTSVDYSIGFIAFTIVIFVRLTLSFYTNNFANLTLEQFDSYPFRIWLRSLYRQG